MTVPLRAPFSFITLFNSTSQICWIAESIVKVIDLPLLDTTRTDGLIGQVISDIVLQLLGFVAEQERAFIRQRQAEGIACAKAKGKKLGRPAIQFPDNWNEVYEIWQAGKITAREAMKRLNMKPTSFYKLVNCYQNKTGHASMSRI